jgi:hypothetical protein
MGYTNYYYQKKNLTQKQWEKVCLETFQILDYCKGKKIELAFECDVPKPPEVSNDMIRFNGVNNEGHETFIFFKKKPEVQAFQTDSKEYFYFCKTARKPYDLAVCLVLLSLANHAPKSVTLGSDGDWDVEWTEARRVYKELFGVEVESFQKAA